MTFDGEVIAITGGASGIGFATAERVVERGGRVAIIDLRDGAAADAARQIDPDGGKALGLTADVTDAAGNAASDTVRVTAKR